jgi:ferredoxin
MAAGVFDLMGRVGEHEHELPGRRPLQGGAWLLCGTLCVKVCPRRTL